MLRTKRPRSYIRLLATLPRDILIFASVFAVALTILTAPGAGIHGPQTIAAAKRASI
jgi:hypothetical protein